ncbi:MAG: mycothione reductase [Acidimicrobiales bacterium]
MKSEHFDVVFVGSGSGNMVLDERFENMRVAMIEKDVFGGTCLNRGCVPSKMFVMAADSARVFETSSRLGVHGTLDHVDWKAIRDRVFSRIDPIAAGGRDYRLNQGHLTVFEGYGRFTGHKEMEVNGTRITADRWLLGAGARPQIPEIPGLSDVTYETSDNIMRRDTLPERLIVLGSGFIAAELGHVFGAYGSHVSFVLRSGAFLRKLDSHISSRFTQLYSDRFDVYPNSTTTRVSQNGDIITLEIEGPEGSVELTGDALLIATGRVPNGDQLNVEASGIATDATGRRVLTNAELATNVDGIYAFGDLTNEMQLKHLANAEAKISSHNLLGLEKPRTIDRTYIPAAVFASPQIAWIGLSEEEAKQQYTDVVTVTHNYSDTAYGWALEDTTSFIKLIARRETDNLVGAYIIGPQASTLLQPIQQGMQLGASIKDMAENVYYTHPALTEVNENALLKLVVELKV